MDVIIGIDPHKRSHTAVAIDTTETVLGRIRVAADRRQLDQLLAFAEQWPERRWAVEGAGGLGRLIAQQLTGAEQTVIDVPATLSARVRLLSGGSARKTDSHDARSTAIAALHGRQLRTVTAEDATVVLRLLSDRRDQVSAERNRIVCRLHNQFRHLRPGGAKTGLSADQRPPSSTGTVGRSPRSCWPTCAGWTGGVPTSTRASSRRSRSTAPA